MPGLLFRGRAQIATAAALRKKGYGVLAARRLSQTIDDDTIDMAVAMAPPDVQDAYVALMASEGNVTGPWLDAILQFLESDLGKVLIAILLSLLGV